MLAVSMLTSVDRQKTWIFEMMSSLLFLHFLLITLIKSKLFKTCIPSSCTLNRKLEHNFKDVFDDVICFLFPGWFRF